MKTKKKLKKLAVVIDSLANMIYEIAELEKIRQPKLNYPSGGIIHKGDEILIPKT